MIPDTLGDFYNSEVKAERLLLTFLSPAQQAEWETHHRVIETGRAGVTWEIYTSGLVKRSGFPELGLRQMYCINPAADSLPLADRVLAKLLWVRADCEALVRRANFLGYL